jgi:hypothetical protein
MNGFCSPVHGRPCEVKVQHWLECSTKHGLLSPFKPETSVDSERVLRPRADSGVSKSPVMSSTKKTSRRTLPWLVVPDQYPPPTSSRTDSGVSKLPIKSSTKNTSRRTLPWVVIPVRHPPPTSPRVSHRPIDAAPTSGKRAARRNFSGCSGSVQRRRV